MLCSKALSEAHFPNSHIEKRRVTEDIESEYLSFTATGMDYLGPISYNSRNSSKKIVS